MIRSHWFHLPLAAGLLTICGFVLSLSSATPSAAAEADVEAHSSVFNPQLSPENGADIKEYYRQLGRFENFGTLSKYELHKFARETIRIGKLQEWLSREPHAYGCRKSTVNDVRLNCLTKGQRDAIYDYKDDEEYQNINDALRLDLTLPEGRRAADNEPQIARIRSALSRLKPVKQLTFRGVKYLEPFKDLRKGDDYSDRAFFSSSLAASVGVRFSRGQVLIIAKTRSCPFLSGAESGTLSFDRNELEVLCAPGTPFRVHEVLEIEGYKVLFLIEK